MTPFCPLIFDARNGGEWGGAGITSTAAASRAFGITNLGILTQPEYASTSFGGVTVGSTDILVKYTYNGDTDFNEVINFDDYSRIDNGINQSLTGWRNGDFDHNTGVPDFDDYALIDMAYLKQDGPLSPGGGDPRLIAMGQMEHFTYEYMMWFIDWNAQRGVIYTIEDFYPDGL